MRANDGTGQRGHVTPKHVFVDGTSPGILLDWKAVGGKWLAHVVWATGDLHSALGARVAAGGSRHAPGMTKRPTPPKRGGAVRSC